MLRKTQNTADIVIAIPLIKKDGSQATGLTLGTLSTKIIKPDGTALVGYTEATFSEPNSDGVYVCKFLSGAATKAFTLSDQANPYVLTLDSSTTDVEPSTVEVAIVSLYTWEVAKESSMTRALGLLFDNHVEDDIVRDGTGNKLSSNIYIYDSSANAALHDKVTGLIGKVSITGTYTAGKLSKVLGSKVV